MVWKIEDRATDLEPDNRTCPPSKEYLKHLSAEQRMAEWQKELAAKRQS